VAVTLRAQEARILKEANPPADATLALRTPARTYQFFVEHKQTHLTYAVADLLLTNHPGRERAKWILFAPYVGRKMAQKDVIPSSSRLESKSS